MTISTKSNSESQQAGYGIQDRIAQRAEKWGAYALSTILFYPLLNAFIYLLAENAFKNGDVYAKYAMLTLESIVIGIALFYAFALRPMAVIGPYFLVSGIILLTYIAFPQNMAYVIPNLKNIYVFCVPSLVLLVSIHNYRALLTLFTNISYIIAPIGILVGVMQDIENYSMWYSYVLLIPLAFLTHRIFTRPHIVSFALVITMVAMILKYGSRGAVVWWVAELGLLILFSLFFNHKELYKYMKLKYFFYAAIMAFAVLLLGLILIPLYIPQSVLQSIGSRSIRLILSGNFIFDVSERDMVYSNVVNMISQAPQGLGICGEMVWFEQLDIKNMYAHNLFLEIIVHWGALLGVLIIFLLIIIVMFFWRYNTDEYLYRFFIIFFSIGFLPLMVSDSYIKADKIWLFFSICLIGISRGRKILKK